MIESARFDPNMLDKTPLGALSLNPLPSAARVLKESTPSSSYQLDPFSPSLTPQEQQSTQQSQGAIPQPPGLGQQALGLAGNIGLGSLANTGIHALGDTISSALPSIFGNAASSAGSLAPDAFNLANGLGAGADFGVNLAGNLAGDTGAAAATSGLGSLLLPAAGVYGGYNVIKNLLDNKKDPIGSGLGGAAAGAAIGSVVPGIGTLIGGLIGGAGGGLLGLFGSGGPNPREQQAAALRDSLKNTGLADPSVKSGLAYQGTGGNKVELTKDNIDYTDPITGQAVGHINPIAHFLAQGNKSAAEDLGAILAEAVKKNSNSVDDVKNNTLAIIHSLGIKYGDVANFIKGDKTLDNGTRDLYMAMLQNLSTPGKDPYKLEDTPTGKPNSAVLPASSIPTRNPLALGGVR